MTIRAFILSVLTFVYIGSAVAIDNDFSFRHLRLQEGLSNSHTNCITQDHEGFIWIGTANGLNKFNGYNFTYYYADTKEDTTLLSGEIFSLLVDKRNTLWVGTYRGLHKYNAETDNFSYIPLDPVHGYPIRNMIDGEDYTIWIATAGSGLIKYNTKNDHFIAFTPDSKGETNISSNDILTIYKESNDRLWIGTVNNGVDIYDIKKNRFKNINLANTFTNTRNCNSVECFYKLSEDTLLIGTRNGLYYYNESKKQLSEFFYNKEKIITKDGTTVYSICKDRQNRLWISTNGEGVICIDRNTGNIFRLKHDKEKSTSLINENNRSLFEDRQGNIWIVSYQGGINILPNKIRFFENYNLFDPDAFFKSNTVTSITTDSKNNVWVGTDGGGLKYIDRSAQKTCHYYPKDNLSNSIPDKVIMSLLIDKKENLWIGTYSGGLSVYNRKDKSFKNYKKTEQAYSLSNNYAAALLQDKRGNIWIGTNGGGLNKYNPSTGNFTAYISEDTTYGTSLVNNWINAIAEDNNGRIWIGTFWGLSVFDPDANYFINYLRQRGEAHNISNNVIYSIIETSDNEIWIGTRNGLNKFLPHRNSFQVYTVANGLPGNIIYGIEEDNRGNLWISTNHGLCKLNPKTGETNNYFESDGLQSNEFTRGASYKSSTGELFFGGIQGLNSFHPDSIYEQYQIPKPVISEFQIFDQKIRPGHAFNDRIILTNPISKTPKIRLKHSDNSFSFELAALDFILPEKNFYQYKMEGFDNAWKSLDLKQHKITYTNLDAGTYIFKFKASSIDNQWSDDYSQLIIQIDPPPYKTWWAYALYGLFIVGLMLTIWNFFAKRIKLQGQIKLERVERQKSEELNQAKLRFFTNISHEFRTPITLILGPIEKLLSDQQLGKKYKQTFLLMHKNANRLLRLVNQLIDLRKVESGSIKLKVTEGDIIKFLKEIYAAFGDYAVQKGIDFQFISDLDELKCWFDEDKIDKIIFNLLSNAFKFTPKHGEIILSAFVEETAGQKQLKIMVKDTGRGIPEKDKDNVFTRFYQISNKQGIGNEGSGVGLSLTKNLVEIHKGTIDFISAENSGTSFTVKLPLNDEIYSPTEKFDLDARPEKHNISDLPIMDTENVEVEDAFRSNQTDKYKILIVEDNFDLRKYIAAELALDYQIIEAENGKEGIQKTMNELPDLIISDVLMPEMDGFEFCKQVKSNLLTNHIPVILLTAKTSIEQRIEGIEMGADSYIPKPFHPEHVKVRVRKLIELRFTLKQKFSAQMHQTDLEVKPHHDKFLEKITEVIKKNITDTELNIESLSKIMGMSRSNLHRKLVLLTDKSPSEFVRIIKLNESLTLLKKKQYNISEVSYMVGFNSLSYFTNCFKNHFHISPTEYLEKLNK